MRSKAWLLYASVLVCGCGEQVVGGAEFLASPPGAGGSGSGSSTGSGTNPNGVSAIALRGGDPALAAIPSYGPGTPWSDPNNVVVVFGNQPESCADPYPPAICVAETTWHQAYALPLDLIASGRVDLEGFRTQFYEDAAIAPASYGQCQGGNGQGPGLAGWIEIGDDGADAIELTLQGGVQAMTGLQLDGAYHVPRCGPRPDTPPPFDVPAALGKDLGAQAAAGDADTLYVVLGTNPASACGGSLDCAQTSWLSLRLPKELRASGRVQLDDARVAATVTPIGCLGGATPLTTGELQVEQVSGSEVVFSLFRAEAEAGTGVVDFDGRYRTVLCP